MRISFRAILVCTCQVLIYLIKGSLWGLRSLHLHWDWHLWSSRQVCTGRHCCCFHDASGPYPTICQLCCPCLSCTSAFCCVIVFYVLPKGKEMGLCSALWLCGCWLRAGTFDWWIITGFACLYLPKTLFTDHDPIFEPQLCTPGTGCL